MGTRYQVRHKLKSRCSGVSLVTEIAHKTFLSIIYVSLVIAYGHFNLPWRFV